MNIEALNLEGKTILGQGVWGRVYDLADGTVIKMAKRAGGVGDGIQKVEHEKNMLMAMEDVSQSLPFSIPVYLGYGALNSNSKYCAQGYDVWLHSSKTSGSIYTVKAISSINQQQVSVLAENLGCTLASFHHMLDQTDLDQTLKPDRLFDDADEIKRLLSSEDRQRFDRVVEYIELSRSAKKRPIHGDFNISNILWEGNEVSGILDFAEMCLGYIEDDICSITLELPQMKEELIAAYETLSGARIDRKTLFLSEMKRDLIGLLICGYKLSRNNEAEQNRQKLDRALSLAPKFV